MENWEMEFKETIASFSQRQFSGIPSPTENVCALGTAVEMFWWTQNFCLRGHRLRGPRPMEMSPPNMQDCHPRRLHSLAEGRMRGLTDHIIGQLNAQTMHHIINSDWYGFKPKHRISPAKVSSIFCSNFIITLAALVYVCLYLRVCICWTVKNCNRFIIHQF